MPEVGRQVLATLKDGSVIWACWSGYEWYQELDDHPASIPLQQEVVSWSYD